MSSFEMLWNCGSCGTAELLGVTHRHCPNCGAAQDPKARYFPPAGNEVATKGHVFVGKDRICKACNTPGAANIKFCGSCGCPTDGNSEVELIKDGHSKKNSSAQDAQQKQLHRQQQQQQQKGAAARKLNIKFLAGLGVAILLGLASFIVTFEKEVIVTDHSWERSIEVEAFREVSESSECSAVPSSGKVTRRYQDQRSRQVSDGQECSESCSTVRVDHGDGSFGTENQCNTVCSAKYRTEYYTVSMCAYDIGRWVVARTERTSGRLAQEPKWPIISLAKSKGKYGMERSGTKSEHYELALKTVADKSEILKCEISDLASWKSFKPKQKINIRQNIYGSVACPAAALLAH